MTPLAGFNQ